MLYFTARSSKERHTQIFMGRDKVENEDLIKYGLPEDIWCGPRPSTRIAAVEVANTRMGRCTTHSCPPDGRRSSPPRGVSAVMKASACGCAVRRWRADDAADMYGP